MATIPPVGTIEAALDAIKLASGPKLLVFDRELKEFRTLGPARLDALAKSSTLPAGISDVERGYLLGLETARACLQGMPAAAAAGVEL